MDINIGIVQSQVQFCKERKYQCEVTDGNDMVGFAIETQGKTPINGLRHPRTEGASGWYIWCGEKYSLEPNFFSPLHLEHLNERCPEIIRLLGLPPGYRFLLAGEYLDIWYDPRLLDI